MSARDGLWQSPEGAVVIFDGVTMVRIHPGALPRQPSAVEYAPPRPTMRTTLGAIRAWCEPKGEDDPPFGSLCGVAVDWQQAWWTLGQIFGTLHDDTRVGLARADIGHTPAVAIVGDGWDVLIAGLDPRKVGRVPDVPLSPSRLLVMVKGGAS